MSKLFLSALFCFDGFSEGLVAVVMQVKTVARIVEGDAGKAICKEAERLKPVALVMGTRGRSLIKRYLFMFGHLHLIVKICTILWPFDQWLE